MQLHGFEIPTALVQSRVRYDPFQRKLQLNILLQHPEQQVGHCDPKLLVELNERPLHAPEVLAGEHLVESAAQREHVLSLSEHYHPGGLLRELFCFLVQLAYLPPRSSRKAKLGQLKVYHIHLVLRDDDVIRLEFQSFLINLLEQIS